MTGIVELAAAVRTGATGSRRPVLVGDLRVGMTIALPFRERYLPWLVLAEPVPVSPTTAMVMLQRIRQNQAPGTAMSIRFFRRAVVERLPRHYGVCSRCGGLSPCVDEWVESALAGRESASTPPMLTRSPEGGPQ